MFKVLASVSLQKVEVRHHAYSYSCKIQKATCVNAATDCWTAGHLSTMLSKIRHCWNSVLRLNFGMCKIDRYITGELLSQSSFVLSKETLSKLNSRLGSKCNFQLNFCSLYLASRRVYMDNQSTTSSLKKQDLDVTQSEPHVYTSISCTNEHPNI